VATGGIRLAQGGLLARNDYGPAGLDLAVEFQRVIEHFYGEGFLVSSELEMGRHSP
jgi:hypothetical protein